MKTIAIIADLGAAALLTACAGAPSRLDSAPSMFDRPPSGAERAQLDSIRANLAQQLASGMNFRFAGTASGVLINHGIPSIVVGQGNVIRVSLVKSSAPQVHVSVIKPNTRQPD